MDYSNLIAALQEGDSRKANELIEALRPRLVAFLRIHMNASEADAQDCAQEALLSAIQSIKEDRIKNHNRVVQYIMSICKNDYLKMKKKHHEEPLDEIPDGHQHGPHQLQSILDEAGKVHESIKRQVSTIYGVLVRSSWCSYPKSSRRIWNQCKQRLDSETSAYKKAKWVLSKKK